MILFRYRGRDSQNGKKSGFVEEETLKGARKRLFSMGICPETVKPASFLGSFDKKSRAAFYAETGMLLKGGFSVEEALRLLGEESEGKREGILHSLRLCILEGMPLSEAVRLLAGKLPPFEAAALATAERTGAQPDLLSGLALFMEQDEAVREKVKSSLAYPAGVFVLAVSLMSAVVFLVLPRAAEVFPEGRIPESTERLIAFLPMAMTAFLSFLALLSAAAVFLAVHSRRNGKVRLWCERTLFRLPLSGKLLSLLWASRFAGTMALLASSGIPPQSAISPSGAATGSLWLTELSERAEESVKRGEGLLDAVLSIRPVAGHLVSWISVGEKSGSLEEMLRSASQRARGKYETMLSRMLSSAEPIMIAFAGVVVLLVALAIIRPMLDLTTRGL